VRRKQQLANEKKNEVDLIENRLIVYGLHYKKNRNIQISSFFRKFQNHQNGVPAYII
jgi:hypothetical protein